MSGFSSRCVIIGFLLVNCIAVFWVWNLDTGIQKPILKTLSIKLHSFTNKRTTTAATSTMKPKPIMKNVSHKFNSTIPKKTIFFMPSWWNGHYLYLKEANQFCPRCQFIEDEKFKGPKDAVVFHGRFLPKKVPKRNPKEIWVFMLFEALSELDPSSKFKKISMYDGLFNLTMTYRKDSDIHMPYGRFVNISKVPRPPLNTTWAFISGSWGHDTYSNIKYEVTPSLDNFNYRKPVAWVTSHCKPTSGRHYITQELNKFIPIDTFGECGDHKCKVSKSGAITGVDCRIQIGKQYKFYLSFESSLCVDYVTEKFFEVLSATDMIPVVFGGANYEQMFPSKSFINVKNFKSAQQLAEYLTHLSNNPTQWLEYFKWRSTFWVQNNRFVTGYCDLCDKLWTMQSNHTGSGGNKYPRMWEWWTDRIVGNKSAGKTCENFTNTTHNVWKTS